MTLHERKNLIISDNECLYWNDKDGEYVVTVWYDEFPSDPREDPEAQINHMMCWNRNWSLGDCHDYQSPLDFARTLADRFHVAYDSEDMSDAIMKRIADKGYIVFLPVWAYEHSGITISCGERVYPYNDRWDSYQTGYIYQTREEALKLGYAPETWKEDVIKGMKMDVEEYDHYISGEVFGFSFYTKQKGEEEYIEEENVAGFIGLDLYENGIVSEAGVPADAEIRTVESVFGDNIPA